MYIRFSFNVNKKLCCRKEAARRFVSELLQYKTLSGLLLSVVSASHMPLRTIRFYSVLFSSAYSYMHAAGGHEQTFAGASPTLPSILHGRR